MNNKKKYLELSSLTIKIKNIWLNKVPFKIRKLKNNIYYNEVFMPLLIIISKKYAYT